ncbi:MAG: HlyC/CorC family transporter [Bryobacteraceae bacterium]|nr:HlyC/CorC family transporter [Bryobacteraceae bacterium]
MVILIPILIILMLLLLNAIFVAAEFSLIGVPRATVDRRASEGNRVAKLLANVLNTPRLQDQYIATAQLGITVASLGLGMYGEHAVAGWIAGWLHALGPAAQFAEHTVASVISIVLLTYLHIVLGEMIPKTLALQHAERTSLWIIPLMSWIRIAVYPLVVGLNAVGNGLLRIAGITRTTTHQSHSPEELELIIEESEKGGVLDESSADLMTKLLTLRETNAGQIMVPRVRITGLSLNAPAEELREVLARTSHTRYPVYDKNLDTIVGVIHVKYLLPYLLSDRPLSQDHVQTVPFVPETMAVENVANAMRAAGVQVAVVMDEHGGTAGILTEKDLLDNLLGEMHEDSEQSQIWRDPEGIVHVAGTALLTDLGEELEQDFEHEEIDTVSGLVLALLERPPEPEDKVEYLGVRLVVKSVTGHGVESCRVELIPVEPDEEKA